MTPLERLTQIEEQIKKLETEKRAIYLASISAPEEEKVIEDYYANILSKDSPFPKFEMPITVNGIISEGESVVATGVADFMQSVINDPDMAPEEKEVMLSMYGHRKPGSWVAIRPCAKECENKTYLGLLLGEIALSFGIKFNRKEGILCVYPCSFNPAIFVFDLGKIVFGAESWWGHIKSPEDMKRITNQDIDNVWYVQAMKAMAYASASGEKKTEPAEAQNADDAKMSLWDSLKSLGCFGFRNTKGGFKCEFDGGLQRVHIDHDGSYEAELGPMTMYIGGLTLEDVGSVIRRLKAREGSSDGNAQGAEDDVGQT